MNTVQRKTKNFVQTSPKKKSKSNKRGITPDDVLNPPIIIVISLHTHFPSLPPLPPLAPGVIFYVIFFKF